MSILAKPRLPRTIASFLAVAGAVGAVAAATPPQSSAAPLTTPSYDFTGMPDLDQHRNAGVDAAGVTHAGLPGNGDAYCGPTSAMDAFGWLAQHGDPTLQPGVQDWTLAPNYEPATALLARMGQTMMTDPVNGTTEANFENGLQAWQAANGNRYYQATFLGSDMNDDAEWAPDLSAASRAMQHGAPVMLRIGWYRTVTRTVKGRTISVLERTGGHWVVMTGYGPEGVTFVDPDDTANRMAPSARAHVTHPLGTTNAVFGGKDPDGTEWLWRGWRDDGKGTVTFPTEKFPHIAGYAGNDGYIEGFTVLRPTWTLSLQGVDLKYTEGGHVHTWPIPGGKLADAQVSPVGDAVYFATKGSRVVYKGNPDTGATTRLAQVSAPITKLSVRMDRLQVASGGQLTTLTSRGVRVGSVLRPNATLPATQIDPAVLQAPKANAATTVVSNPNHIDTAVETPSLLTERVIRRSVPIRATGRNAQVLGR